jgi:hypothetical protein
MTDSVSVLIAQWQLRKTSLAGMHGRGSEGERRLHCLSSDLPELANYWRVLEYHNLLVILIRLYSVSSGRVPASP